MFGMTGDVKKIFRIGGRQYELVEVDGPLCRGSKRFATQFDHDAGILKISRTVPVDQRPWAVAVAVSDACFRLWRPIPVIWPNWQPADRAGGGRILPDTEGGPPRP